jgi:hypothetical protein
MMPVSSLMSTGRWWFGVLALVAPSLGGLNIIVTNGYMDGRFVGNFTSQIAVAVLPMFPAVTSADWVSGSEWSGTACRPQYPAVTVRCLPLPLCYTHCPRCLHPFLSRLTISPTHLAQWQALDHQLQFVVPRDPNLDRRWGVGGAEDGTLSWASTLCI